MWTCVHSKVKSIGSHRLHRQLEMRSGMLEETGEDSGKRHRTDLGEAAMAHSVIHDMFIRVESILACVYFSLMGDLVVILSFSWTLSLTPTDTHHLRADNISAPLQCSNDPLPLP